MICDCLGSFASVGPIAGHTIGQYKQAIAFARDVAAKEIDYAWIKKDYSNQLADSSSSSCSNFRPSIYPKVPPGILDVHGFHADAARGINIVIPGISDVKNLMMRQSQITCSCHKNPGIRLLISEIG